jgi:hypothetical protein
MICARCAAFDEAERSAIERRELPEHGLACDCESESAEPLLDVLLVPPERFRRSPQVGIPCRLGWAELAAYLARPTVSNTKDAAGAWSAARYRDNVRRKGNLVHACALVMDVDQGGDVDRVAALRSLQGVSPPSQPKNREASPRQCSPVRPIVSPAYAVRTNGTAAPIVV